MTGKHFDAEQEAGLAGSRLAEAGETLNVLRDRVLELEDRVRQFVDHDGPALIEAQAARDSAVAELGRCRLQVVAAREELEATQLLAAEAAADVQGPTHKVEGLEQELAEAHATVRQLRGDNDRLVDSVAALQRKLDAGPAPALAAVPMARTDLDAVMSPAVVTGQARMLPPEEDAAVRLPGPAPVLSFPNDRWLAGPVGPDDIRYRGLVLPHPFDAALVDVLAAGPAPVRYVVDDPAGPALPNPYLQAALRADDKVDAVDSASGHFYCLGRFEETRRLVVEADVAVLGSMPGYLRLVEAIAWNRDPEDYPGTRAWAADGHQPLSFGVRVVMWDADGAEEPRLGLHLLHASGAATNMVAEDGQGRKLWLFPADAQGRATEVHSRTFLGPFGASWEIDDAHRFDRASWHLIGLELDAGSGPADGSAVLSLAGEVIATVTGIRWSASHPVGAWNHAGLALQVGGTDPALLPPSGAVQVAVAGLDVYRQ